MSMFSNYEVTKKFFEVYFKALGPESLDLTKKQFITIHKKGGTPWTVPSTLPLQLAMKASNQTMRSFFGDLFFKVFGGALSAAVDIAMTYGKKLMQESADFIYDTQLSQLILGYKALLSSHRASPNC